MRELTPRRLLAAFLALEASKWADFVVLDGDLLTDILNTRSIRRVAEARVRRGIAGGARTRSESCDC
jgi:hypothetical protein